MFHFGRKEIFNWVHVRTIHDERYVQRRLLDGPDSAAQHCLDSAKVIGTLSESNRNSRLENKPANPAAAYMSLY